MRSQREPIFRWIRFARHRISAAKRSISNRSHGSFVNSSHSICTRKAFVTIRQKIWHRARRIIHLIKLRWVSSNGSKIRRVDLQSEPYAEEQKSRKVRKTSYDTWKWGFGACIFIVYSYVYLLRILDSHFLLEKWFSPIHDQKTNIHIHEF